MSEEKVAKEVVKGPASYFPSIEKNTGSLSSIGFR